ncbi:hypothetical protein LBMAG56_49700 [Verrucomicrobiota bacterium]|nr:hypothetical protein LBMAG56_49700 [Verrucomicrobiota bacterium]
MNLLDENFPCDQAALLVAWRVPCRQIGHEVARLGTQDEEIIPLLHRLRRVTLFTLDEDFHKRRLAHASYCLAWLDVRADDAALTVRRFLRHARFNAVAKRMGIVARLGESGVHFWQRNQTAKMRVGWNLS